MNTYSLRFVREGIWLPVAASAVALAGALISQYGFDLHPCELCLWQRVPYVAALVLGLIAPFCPDARGRRYAPYVLAALVASSGLIGAFHVGVEHHWWTFGSGCSGPAVSGSVDDILAAIKGAPLVRCDTPQFVFLGLSMAGWNVLYGLGAALVTVLIARRPRP